MGSQLARPPLAASTGASVDSGLPMTVNSDSCQERQMESQEYDATGFFVLGISRM